MVIFTSMTQNFCIYSVGEVTHTKDWNFKVPGSIFWRIYKVTEGNSRVRIYNHEYKLSPGFFYLIPAFMAHEDILTSSFSHQYLHFKLEDPTIINEFRYSDIPFEIKSQPVLEMSMKRIREICKGFELTSSVPREYEQHSSYLYWTRRYESLSFADRLEVEAHLRILLSAFLKLSKRGEYKFNPRTLKARLYIDRHLADRISVQELAEISEMRTESFIRAFTKEFHITPLNYIIDSRIRKAKNLLLLSVYSIKEIAIKCGFESPSYFCQTFKKYTHQSPGNYRRSEGLGLKNGS